MSMEMQAWTSLYHAMHAEEERRPFSRATLRRIAGFARPHRRRLAVFLVLSVVGAALAVATPVLAGRVVDAIDRGGPVRTVVGLAALIAGIAVAEAGLGVLTRWFSARIGEGLILDLRAAVFAHVQRMPVAFFTRTRTGALVSRLNNDVIGAQRAFSDTLSGVVGQRRHARAGARRHAHAVVAGHRARAGSAARVRRARTTDRAAGRRACSARPRTTTRPWAAR